MGVRGIDENVRSRNAGGVLDFLHNRIEQIAGEHQHVAGDQGELFSRRLFDHDRNRAKLTFLPIRLHAVDHAAQDHGVVGVQVHGCRADPQVGRGRGR